MTRSSTAKGPEAYRLGRLPFVFSGSGACADYLRDELASLRELASGDASPAAPLLAFHFVDALPPLADYTATRPVYAREGSFRVSYNGLTYDVGCPDHAGGALGYLIGPFIKSQLYNDKPWKRNLPTAPMLLVRDEREFEKEKSNLLETVKKFYSAGPTGITKHPHPMFGRFTPEQWGQSMFKHMDHHLSQFGV